MNLKKNNSLFFLVSIVIILITSCNRIDKSSNIIAPQNHLPFDPDREVDSLSYNQLIKQLGPLKKPSKNYKFGAIMKYMGNPYWQLLADGMATKAEDFGATIYVRSGINEMDPQSQSVAMQAMSELNYDAILVSPQTNKNLDQAIIKAQKKGILIISVDDAISNESKHFVGPNQYENGVHAARFLIERIPKGGEVALIRGPIESYAVNNRSQGFIDTIKGTKLKLVADETGLWDFQKSLEIGKSILNKFPKLVAFYCNNDIMALGIFQSVKNMNRQKQTLVVGTDGIGPAMDSILNNELSATIDSFPFLTGQIAIEIAIRLLQRQKVPRVIYSPQTLVTRESLINSKRR